MPERPSIEALLANCPSAEFKARLRSEIERKVRMQTGAREGFTAVTPYLRATDVEKIIAFAQRAFGAVETERATGAAGGLHCEIRVGDSMLMLGGGPMVTPAAATFMGMHYYVDDVDSVYRRAIEAGGKSLGEPADMPYGERSGFVQDPGGNHWYIATRKGEDYMEGRRMVTPHIVAKRGSEYIEFLKAALGASVEFRHDSPEGRVMHAVLRIQGGALEIGESDPPAASALYLYVPDADALYRQAIGAGAKSLRAPADQPYGDRMGSVEDPWGNHWHIATHLARGKR